MAKPNNNGHGAQSGIGSFTTISGGGQADRLFGSDGANYIDGKGGNDYLNGGGGDDTLNGGTGLDQFVLKAAGGHDVINDFQAGEDIFMTFGFMTNHPGDPVHDGAPHQLQAGETFTTDEGHVLTIGVDGAGNTTMTWDTGDSLVLKGVSPEEISSASLAFYGSDYGWQF